MRCYLAMKNNKWLPRLKDSRETEDILISQAGELKVG
jgi:hypothetical protein